MKWTRNRNKDKDATLKPGMVFEKYTVVKELGRGGMGAVFLVRHNVLDSLFALKVLAPDIALKNKQFVDRFIREAKLACKIKHPNLITVHDAGTNPQNGLYYIIMDYVPGGSVRDLLKKTHRIPPARALEIITQVAGALTAANAHHMVHRDIKPDNIMFAADGSAKLADLGIAKSTDEQDTMLTMAASVFGTPAYMSPEQARDSSRVDSRADIYSLGIVFFEMLSGQRPFTGDTAIQILSQVMDVSCIPDIRRICPDVPPELADLISRMTEKNLEKRIPNPDVLVRELKKIRIPDQIGSVPLRTRNEIVAAALVQNGRKESPPDETMPTVTSPEAVSPVSSTATPVPSAEFAPDVTIPTMTSEVATPAAQPTVSASGFTPDVTMPTMSSEAAPTPAAQPTVSASGFTPDVTMPTMSSEAAPTPAAQPTVSALSFTPDVTMPTMSSEAAPTPAAQPTVSASGFTPDEVTPTMISEAAPTPAAQPTVSASGFTPDVTMPTMSSDAAPTPAAQPTVSASGFTPDEATMSSEAAPTPAAQPTVSASGFTPEETTPTIGGSEAAPAPQAETVPEVISGALQDKTEVFPEESNSKNEETLPRPSSSPETSGGQASFPRKSPKGVVLIAVSAACLMFVLGAALIVMFFLKRDTSASPGSESESDSLSSTVVDSGGASDVGRTSPGSTSVSEQKSGGEASELDVADAATAGKESGGVEVAQTVVPDDAGEVGAGMEAPSVSDEMTSDPLRSHQIVLLADTSSISRNAKTLLADAFGADKVSFQEAAGMGSYKQELNAILKSSPSFVVICFALQYAEDGISASGYETVISYQADCFREKGIPFLFIQPDEDEDDEHMQPFLTATRDLCRYRSIPLVGVSDLTDGSLVSLVREMGLSLDSGTSGRQ